MSEGRPERIRIWKEQNQDRVRQHARDWAKKWRLAHPGLVSQRNRYYALKNPAGRAANQARRQAAKKMRTPAWADPSAIRAVYVEAARLTRSTGVWYTVDHVVPLQGALVSGLHVFENLQILTHAENSKKHNIFEVS